MRSEFAIDISPPGTDPVVVAVHGGIDLFTTPEFEAAVAEALSRGTGAAVIDLTLTSFLDSSSLGVLIGAHRRLSRRGGRLVLACDQPAVLKVLRTTGLDGVFDVVAAVPDHRPSAGVL